MAGQSRWTHQLVEAKGYCYICEQRLGTIVDEVGGRLCQECHDDIERMRLHYALKSGYTVRRGGHGEVRNQSLDLADMSGAESEVDTW